MKNIFKIKRQPHRSNDVQTPQPPPAAAAAAVGAPPSCGADHRAKAEEGATSGDLTDYISSEEEFQVQLALAISASNSDFWGDPDGDQISTAKLLSLGRHPIVQAGEEGTAESLSRHYWDYSVLDYGEKVVDGFYDICGLSVNSTNQAKMPSLVDLQTSIGDLGFEAIIVNHARDPALVELQQVAQCILLDCPVAKTELLVQRLSELVMEHMGGPVKDANDMLTRWLEKSTELRTSQQTSLIPLGCIRVGLSRHRALLFKVLADNVCIPCRLVKGSHYTGIDDDAINIVKLDNDREFLVDLMAAPGTLIPADVLSMKDTSLDSYNPKVSKSLTSCTENIPENNFFRLEPLCGEHIGGSGPSTLDNNKALDKRSRYEREILVPSSQIDHDGATSKNIGSSSRENTSHITQLPNQFASSTISTSSKQKGTVDTQTAGSNMREERPNTILSSQDTELSIENPMDSRRLFAELNPFHLVGAGKPSTEFKPVNNRNTGYNRHTENTAPQNPLVWKGRSAWNEVQSKKQNNFVEELFPRKNTELNTSSSQIPGSTGKVHSKVSDYFTQGSLAPFSAESGTLANKVSDTALHSGYPSLGDNKSIIASDKNQLNKFDTHCFDASVERSSALLESSALVMPSREKYVGNNHQDALIFQNSETNEPEEHGQNVNGKHDPKMCPHDRFVGRDMNSKNPESSSSPSRTRLRSLDPMLDDVAECEIPWEDLVIGERIGLGSYGEVYRADWNGTEVAAKKFLDQDFYGDALDEFRSEVRIMRRLRHPNVVLFLGAVTRPPNLSIVSEFHPRGSLYKILHRPNCQIDEKRRITMALDVAKGMNCLHSSVPTIVHRDLKSPNLLVDNNWAVKVCDFGLSRLKHSTFLSSRSTAGTPEWMAPEVLRNEPSNEKCDVYSFGVILWELATLRMPWSGMNPMQVVGAVGFQDRRLDIPKEVDPLVARIIWECWQIEPNLRPSFAQLTTALKSLQRLVIPTHQETQNPPVPQEISVNLTP